MVAGEGMWMKSIANNADIDINMGLFPILTSDDADLENTVFNIPQSFCIYNGSEHVDEAKIALDYMLTSDAADKFFEAMGAYPAYSDSKVNISSLGDLATDFQKYLDEDNLRYVWAFFPGSGSGSYLRFDSEISCRSVQPRRKLKGNHKFLEYKYRIVLIRCAPISFLHRSTKRR